MSDVQWFAFVILPLLVAAIGWAFALLAEQREHWPPPDAVSGNHLFVLVFVLVGFVGLVLLGLLGAWLIRRNR